MAIQPIDLQTLFTQLDKVGRAQTAQREGLALHEAIQGVQIQRKTEEHIQAVNETQNTGDDGIEKAKERGSQRQDSGEGKKKEAGQKEAERDKAAVPVFYDPRLGRNIDISL
jgi:hypothetical protein